ncbi:S-layer homology domain-containing protein [Bacillus sp. Marseille-P3661]|uniref:S-layer homology domain-containing protein n=1 Tax=Bacillus sp. Marseille-P3661 TaxID=1936234 RepID=UPI000C84782D|nr:S-layer homology domain-containing protein [Bacillus sp. Marseille-P3661]
MKSRKLLSSTVAAALATTVVIPAAVTQAENVSFSDLSSQAYYYDDVQWLVQEGIINGYEDGTYRPNVALTREEAASMFVRALNLDVPANAGSILENYSDINGAKWSAGALAAFINAGISNESGQFRPTDPLTREVMASWLVGAFNFKEINSESIPFSDSNQIGSSHLANVKILYQNDIVNGNTDGTYGPKDAVTRGQFASFMKRSMTAPAATPTTPPVTVPFDLEDADSINLKQVKITANHTNYTKQQVNNTSLYKVIDENGNVVKVVDVQVNGKEMILTLEKALKNRAELIVDKSITGTEEDFSLNFSDSGQPELISVTPTSPYSFLMTFSEPLNFGVNNGKEVTNSNLLKSFEIDGYKYTIDNMTVQQHGQALHVELESKLGEGEHELELQDPDLFKDYAGNNLETDSFDFNLKYETTVPKLLEVKNISPNQVTLVFDKQIKLRYRGYIYHTSSANYPSSAKVENGNELVLNFDSDDIITKSTDIIVDSGAIEDLWGNKNTKMIKAIQIANDTTAPSITSAEFIDGTVASSSNIKMKVTFSESVKKDTADDIDRYQLLDGQGNTIKIRDIKFENSESNDKVATFTIDKYYGEVPSQRFTIEVDGIEDLVGNKSSEYEYSFNASSEKPPGDFKAKFVLNDDEDEVLMVIDFGKNMAESGSYAVNHLDKYQLTVNGQTVLIEDLKQVNGLSVHLKTYQNAQRVEITLEKTGELADKWDDFYDNLVDAIDYEDLDELELVVGRVADHAGNRTDSIVNKVKLAVQSEFDKTQVTAKAINTETVELKFDDEIVNFDDDDFVIFYDRDNDSKFDSNEDLDADVSVKTTNGKSIVTFKLDDDLDSDARYDNHYVYIATEDENDVTTENRYGQKIEISNLRVEDGIAPKIKTYRDTEQVYVQPVSNDSSRAIVSIELTDDIDKDTLTRLSFVIGDGKDYEIESAFVENDDKIAFIVKLNGNKASNLVGEYVKQKAAISDDNDNIITGIDVRINEERSSRAKP